MSNDKVFVMQIDQASAKNLRDLATATQRSQAAVVRLLISAAVTGRLPSEVLGVGAGAPLKNRQADVKPA